MAEFFTSDTHFFHANIIRPDYCNRPFRDVEEMNFEMVRRWNQTVGKFDRIWHVGDFAFGKKEQATEVLELLNGEKILVRGNHDRSERVMREMGFQDVCERATLDRDGRRIILHHEPLPQEKWEGCEIHFCGHVHEAWRKRGRTVNVGVDQWGFRPVPLQTLIELSLREDDVV